MVEFHALGVHGSTLDVAAIPQRNAQRSGRHGSKAVVPMSSRLHPGRLSEIELPRPHATRPSSFRTSS